MIIVEVGITPSKGVTRKSYIQPQKLELVMIKREELLQDAA